MEFETKRLVDGHVGRAIRRRRRALGLSQQALAKGLGVSFQQVQKYENGSNRMSASVLYGASMILAAPIESFFAGLSSVSVGGAQVNARHELVSEMLASPDGLNLAQWFMALKRPFMRNSLLIIARELAALEAGGGTGQDRS